MIRTMTSTVCGLAAAVAFTGWASGDEKGIPTVVTLAKHETVAEFSGTKYHRCMGRTSR